MAAINELFAVNAYTVIPGQAASGYVSPVCDPPPYKPQPTFPPVPNTGIEDGNPIMIVDSMGHLIPISQFGVGAHKHGL